MRNSRLGRCLVCLIFLGVPAPGCQMLFLYRPMPVLVRDAETREPIAGASLHLSYPHTRDSQAPFNSAETTGSDGIAHLRAAPYGEFGVRVEASAAGYLSEEMSIGSETIQRIQPGHPFEATERRPAELVVEMYKEPRFAVELIVPVGYRGLVKADVQIQEEATAPVGQRHFRYQVHDGFVQVTGPRQLRRIHPSDYRACYADGTPLNAMTQTTVGFRWLREEGNEQDFVVGTQPEYDMQRRSLAVEEPRSATHGSQSGRRGGRRHHGD